MLPQLDRTCWVALEVTGSAFEVHDMLSSHVDRVLLANPVDLKRLGSGRHTDWVDAARLAKMLAVGTLPTVWVPPQPMREVRRLLYYRSRLASNRRRAINQAKVVLRRAGHLLSRNTDVRGWLTPERLATLPASDRVILLSTFVRSPRWKSRLRESRAKSPAVGRRPRRPGSVDDHRRGAHQRGRHLGDPGGAPPLPSGQTSGALRRLRSVDRAIRRAAPPGPYQQGRQPAAAYPPGRSGPFSRPVGFRPPGSVLRPQGTGGRVPQSHHCAGPKTSHRGVAHVANRRDLSKRQERRR